MDGRKRESGNFYRQQAKRKAEKEEELLKKTKKN